MGRGAANPVRERAEEAATRALRSAVHVSRRNVLRLIEAPDVRLSEADRAAFASAYARAERRPDGLVEYRLPQPKWHFLAWLVQHRRVLLRGVNEADVGEFQPAPAHDASGATRAAVFATPDPIWPIFSAVLDGEHVSSVRHACQHVIRDGRTRRRYFFSIDGDPGSPHAWRGGVVYVLPRGGFRPDRWLTEWASEETVRPLARLPVTPADFPFLDRVLHHTAGESMLRTAVRIVTARRAPAA